VGKTAVFNDVISHVVKKQTDVGRSLHSSETAATGAGACTYQASKKLL